MNAMTASSYINALAADPDLSIVPVEMAAAVLGISEQAVRGRLTTGRLEGQNIGGVHFPSAPGLYARLQLREERIETILQMCEKAGLKNNTIKLNDAMVKVGLDPRINSDRAEMARLLEAATEESENRYGLKLTVFIQKRQAAGWRANEPFIRVFDEHRAEREFNNTPATHAEIEEYRLHVWANLIDREPDDEPGIIRIYTVNYLRQRATANETAKAKARAKRRALQQQQ